MDETYITNLANDYNNVRSERDEAKSRARRACQLLIEEVGADGPADVDEVAERAAAEIRDLRDLVLRLLLEGAEVGDVEAERDVAQARIAAVLFSSRAPLDDDELVEAVLMVIRERDELKAQRDNLLDASKEGAWMARALDAERERDELKARLAHAEADAEQAIHNEAFTERQRIVAYIRARSNRSLYHVAQNLLNELADAIERGEHER